MARSIRSTPLVCSGHTRPVTSLSYSGLLSDRSSYVVLGCKDGKAMLRDGITGDWLGTFHGHKGAVWSVSLSRDSSRAATGSADFSAKVWDAYTGQCLVDLPHKHIVRAVSLSPTTDRLATAGMEKLVRVFDLSKPDAEPLEFSRAASSTSHDAMVRAVLWDPSGKHVFSIGDDQALRMWDSTSGELVHERLFDAKPTSLAPSWHPDIATLTVDKTVHFLNLVDITTHKSFTLPHSISSATLHPDSTPKKFVSGASEDGWVRVYDYESGEELEVNKGHHGPVYCVSYSPDGELYASGSEDGTVRLWQTSPKTFGLWKLVNPEK